MANNEHSRAQYIQALLNQKKLNQANGGVMINPSVSASNNIEDLAKLNTDISTSVSKDLLKENKENSLEQGMNNIFGFVDEIASKFGAGFVGAWEGILDLGATGIGAIIDATGGDGSAFTDWAKQDFGTALAEWTKTYQNATPWGIISNIANGNYSNADWWSGMASGFGNIMGSIVGTDTLKNFREDADTYYTMNDDWVNDTETGQFIGGIAHSIGFMLPSIMTGGATLSSTGSQTLAKAVSLGEMGLSASGKQSEQALNEGATSGQALASGLVSGTIEVVSEIVVGKALEKLAKGLKLEKLLGKFGNINGVDLSGKLISQAEPKQLITNFIEEGAEEVFAEFFAPHIEAIYKGDKAFYDANGQHIAKGEWWKNAMESFLSGGIVGGLSGGVQSFSNTQTYSKNGVELFKNNKRAGEIIKEYESELNKTKKGETSTPRMIELENEFKNILQDIDTNLKDLMNDKSSKGKKYLRNVMSAMYGKPVIEDSKSLTKSERSNKITAITNERVQNFKNEIGKDIYQKVVDSYNDSLSQSGVNLHVNLVDGDTLEDKTNRGFILTKDGEVVINRKYAKEMGQIFKHEAISHGILDMNEDLKNNLVKFIEENDSENYHKLDSDLKGVDKEGKRIYTDEEIEKYERLATYLESKLTNSTELGKVFSRNSATKSKLVALLNKIENNFKKSGDIIDDKIIRTLDKAIKQLKNAKTSAITNTKQVKNSRKLKDDKYARFKFDGEEYNPNALNKDSSDAETKRNEFIDNVSTLAQNYGDYQYEQVGTYETMIKKPYIKAVNEGIAITQSIFEDVFDEFINYDDGQITSFNEKQLTDAYNKITELKDYVEELISEIENVDWNGYDPEYYDLQTFAEEFAEDFIDKYNEYEDNLSQLFEPAKEQQVVEETKKEEVKEVAEPLKTEQKVEENKQEVRTEVMNALRQVRKMKDRYDGNDWIKQLRAKFTLNAEEVAYVLNNSLEAGMITQNEFNSAVDELGIKIETKAQEEVVEQPKVEETKSVEEKADTKTTKNTEDKSIVSPISYMGNKQKLLDRIIPKMPKVVSGRFIDAFSGSLTVALNVNYNNVVANELDKATFGLQQYFKRHTPESVVKYIYDTIKKYNLRTEEGFNKFKQQFNNEIGNEKNHWIDLFILTKLSTSQHTYVNEQGRFEGIFDKGKGLKDKADLTKKIKSICDGTKNMTLTNKNAFDVIREAKAGDMIYVDPPYSITNAPYNNNWNGDDELIRELNDATKRGVKWLMSNTLEYQNRVNAKLQNFARRYEVEHLYKEYKKGQADEVIIRNYNDNGEIIDLTLNRKLFDKGAKNEYQIAETSPSEYQNATLKKLGLEDYVKQQWKGFDNNADFIESIYKGEISLFENADESRKAFKKFIAKLNELQNKKGSPNPFTESGQLKNAYFTPEMSMVYLENVRIGMKNTLFFNDFTADKKTLVSFDNESKVISFSLSGLLNHYMNTEITKNKATVVNGNSIQQVIRKARARFLLENKPDLYNRYFESKVQQLFVDKSGGTPVLDDIINNSQVFDKYYKKAISLMSKGFRDFVEQSIIDTTKRNHDAYKKSELKGKDNVEIANTLAYWSVRDDLFGLIYSQDNQTLKTLTEKGVLNVNVNTIINDFNSKLSEDVKYDIKFSKSLNSDGESLSVEQEKHFENSKARDENGNLLVMYHGSNNYGFTVFDSKFNQFEGQETPHNGVEVNWFTDDKRTATTYVYNNTAGEILKSDNVSKINEILTNQYSKYAKLKAEFIEGKYRLTFLDNNLYSQNEMFETVDFDEFKETIAEGYYYDLESLISNEEKTLSKGKKVYKVYLDVTNPLIVDAKGSNWNSIEYVEKDINSPDIYNSLREKIHSFKNVNEVVKFINSEFAGVHVLKGDLVKNKGIKYYFFESNSLDKSGKPTTLIDRTGYVEDGVENFISQLDGTGYTTTKIVNTRYLVDKAIDEGRDGLIIKNVIDDGGGNFQWDENDGIIELKPSTVIVTLKSANQIKDVDNYSPTDDNDIRYSRDLNIYNIEGEIENDIQRILEENRKNDGRSINYGNTPSGLWKEANAREISKLSQRLLREEIKSTRRNYGLDVIVDKDGNEYLVNAYLYTYKTIKNTLDELRQDENFESIKFQQMLSEHPIEDFKNAIFNLTSADGLSSITVLENGDVVNIMNLNPSVRGWLNKSIELAILNGGKTLDCYNLKIDIDNGINLPLLYSKHGFVPISQIPYNAEYVDSRIKNRFTELNDNHGILFMKNIGKNIQLFKDYDDIQDYISKKVIHFEEWDDAQNYRDVITIKSIQENLKDEGIKYSKKLSTYKEMSTTEDIIESAKEKIIDRLGKDYNLRFPKSYNDFKHKAFSEINSVIDVNKQADRLVKELQKIIVENVDAKGNFEEIGTVGDLLSATKVKRLTQNIRAVLRSSPDKTAKARITRSFEISLERVFDQTKEYGNRLNDVRVVAKLRESIKKQIARNYEITDDAISRDGLKFLFSAFRNLYGSEKGYSAKDYVDNIDKVLSFYNQDTINKKNYPNLPYYEEIRDALLELRDSLGTPVNKTYSTGKTVTIYGSLSAESLSLTKNAMRMISHLAEQSTKNNLVKIKPYAYQSYKVIENMPYSSNEFAGAKLWRSYKRTFAPAYEVVRQILGSNSRIADLITRDMQNAFNKKTLFVGAYNDAIKNKLKELKIKNSEFDKYIDLDGHELTVDQLMDLYISLNVDANKQAIDDYGVQYINKNEKQKTLVQKGHAEELKNNLDKVLPEKYKQLANWLLSTMNSGIKADYIKYYTDTFGEYNGRNEIGEINNNSYWMLSRSYQFINNVEKIVKSPSRIFTHAKTRNDNSNNMVVVGGALSGVMTYIEKLGQATYVMPVYREAINVLNSKVVDNKSIANLLAEKVQPKDVQYLKLTLEDIAGVNQKGDGFFTGLMSRFSVAKLSLNISSMLKQFASIWTSNLPITSTAKGFFMNVFKDENVKKELSMLLNEKDGIGGLKYRESNGTAIKGNLGTLGNMTEQIAKVGMFGISKVDFFTISTGVVTLMYIGENEYKLKIGTPENADFVKEHWADFELTQIGNGALSKNAIRRGDYDDIAKSVFGLLQGANIASLGSQIEKINLYNRNKNVDINKLKEQLKDSEDKLKEFNKKHNDINKLTDDEAKQYVEIASDIEDAKTKIEDYKRYEIAGGNHIPQNMVAGLMAQGIFVALVSELFKRIKGKKDWDDKNIVEIAGNIGLATAVDWIPFVNTVSNLIKGYEVSIPAVSLMNQAVAIVNNGKNGDWRSMCQQLAILIGDATGIPVETLAGYLYGTIKMFDPEMAWELGTVLYGYSSTKATSTLKSYVEKGNYAKASQMVDIIVNQYRGVESTAEVNKEIAHLYGNGFSILPKESMKSYTNDKGEEVNLTSQQMDQFKNIYSLSTSKIENTIKLQDYKTLTQEERAKIIKKIYDTYYSVAKAYITNQSADSKLAQYVLENGNNVDIGTLVIYLNKIANIKESGTKTRKELVFDYVNRLRNLSKNEKLSLLNLAGYSTSSK